MNDFFNIFPWMSLIAGLGGSLHCIGMCGGLVSASCQNQKQISTYQIGRLLGYLLLAFIASLLGSYFKKIFYHSFFIYFPSLLVGGLFIYWGIKSYLGIQIQFPTDRFLNKSYKSLWKLRFFDHEAITRSFFIGLISILLPCGLLYGVILGSLATQDISVGLLSILFFWLGTLPAMMMAPTIVKKIVNPLQLNRPKIYAISMMLIGVLTIGYRIYGQFYQEKIDKNCPCHQTQSL